LNNLSINKSFNVSNLLLILPWLTLFANWQIYFIAITLIFVGYIFDVISKRDFNIKIPHLLIWILLLTWDFFIALKSPNTKDGFGYYSGTVIMPFMLFILFNNLRLNNIILTRFFEQLFITGTILGAYSVYVFIESGFNLKLRIPSLWSDYNMLSTYLMILLFFALSFLISPDVPKTKKYLYTVAFIFILMGILLSQTRAVWLITVFSIFIFFFRKPKVIITVSVVIGILFIFFSYVFIDRFLSIKNFGNDLSSLGRLQAWLSSLILIKQNFFFGYGYDAYIYLRDQVFSFYFVPVIHSHNTYLRSILETGFIGFVLYFWFFFQSLFLSFKLYKNSPSEIQKKFIGGSKLALSALFFVFIFEPYFSLFSGSIFFIWMVINLVYCIKWNPSLNPNLQS
jgi:O-antigen ligase